MQARPETVHVRYERVAAAVVGAAPLLGIPVWIGRIVAIDAVPHADYDALPTMFSCGLFMLACGLVIALAARVTARAPHVRAQAIDSLRFHLWTAGACALLIVLLALLTLNDPVNPTLGNQPRGFMAAATIAALAFGLVLPIVELVRAVGAAIRVWNIS